MWSDLGHPRTRARQDILSNAAPLDSAFVGCNTLSMEVQFTPEQEVRLSQIASVEGVAPARLVRDAALLLIEDDLRFREGVRKGIEQADQGMFIDEAEMDARVSRMLSN